MACTETISCLDPYRRSLAAAASCQLVASQFLRCNDIASACGARPGRLCVQLSTSPAPRPATTRVSETRRFPFSAKVVAAAAGGSLTWVPYRTTDHGYLLLFALCDEKPRSWRATVGRGRPRRRSVRERLIFFATATLADLLSQQCRNRHATYGYA